MKNLLLPFCLILTLSSCFNTEPLHYEDAFLEFSLPIGWHEKETKQPVKSTKYISLQNGKFMADGLITIRIQKGELDLNSIIENYKDIMTNLDLGIVTTETIFENIIPDKFGSYETRSAKYEIEVIGAKSKGMIHTFHYSNKTIFLLFQELNGNEDIYNEGISELEKSLIIKD